jgi:hypothetical protein
MALPATDNFNRAGPAPGANWTGSVGDDLVISASTVVTGTSAGTNASMYWSADTPNAAQYAQVTLSSFGAGQFKGPCVRANATDWVMGDANSSINYQIEWYNGGAFTVIASWASTAATNDIVKITANGSAFELFVNGTSRASGSNGSAPASGNGGIYHYGTVGSVDDFEVGNLAAAPSFNLPQFVAAGAQTVTNTSGATLSPALHAGWAVGDAMIMIIAGRSNGSTITNTFSNTWDLLGSQFLEIGAGNTDLWIGVYGRYAQVGEAAPTVTPDADFLPGSTTGGVSAQIAGFRYTTLVEDVTEGTNTSGAASTWTPPSVTTVTNNAMVITCVATSDDNALDYNTANSFSLAMTGANYDTTTGSDHAVGMGYYVKTTAGAVTMPIWNQSAVGADSWVGVTIALRPGASWWIIDPVGFDFKSLNQSLNRAGNY